MAIDAEAVLALAIEKATKVRVDQEERGRTARASANASSDATP